MGRCDVHQNKAGRGGDGISVYAFEKSQHNIGVLEACFCFSMSIVWGCNIRHNNNR